MNKLFSKSKMYLKFDEIVRIVFFIFKEMITTQANATVLLLYVS